MRTYTWDEYYEKFYDWAESTQVRNLSALTSLGTADEVGEIIIELQVNVPAANRLLRKAVEAKLAFSCSDLIEFLCINDKELATAALHNSVSRLTSADMEDLYGVAEDEDIIQICSEQHLTLPEDLRKRKNTRTKKRKKSKKNPLKKWISISMTMCRTSRTEALGFFGTLFAVIAGAGAASNHGHRHNGRCNGIVPTVHHTMATDTAVGTTDMTMYTDVSLVVIKVAGSMD